MSAKSTARSPQIEVLEPLVLMSASGMDADLCTPDELAAIEASTGLLSSEDFGGTADTTIASDFDIEEAISIDAVIIGDLDNDQLVLSGDRSQYRITDLRNGAIRIADGQASEIVNDISTLIFNGQAVAIEDLDFDAVMAVPVRFVAGSDPLPPGPIPVEADGGIGDGAGPIPVGSTDTANIPGEDFVFPEDPDDFVGIAGSSPGFPGPIPVEVGDGAGPTPLPFPIQLIEGPDGEIREVPIGLIEPGVVGTGVVGTGPSDITEVPAGEGDSPRIAVGFPDSPDLPDSIVGMNATGGPVGVSIGAPTGSPNNGGTAGNGEVIDLETPVFADFTTTSVADDAGNLDVALLENSLTTAGIEAQSGLADGTPAAADSLVVTADPLAGIPIEQPPTFTPTVQGTDVGEWISGIVGDAIAAGGGDDEIYVPAGATIVDGGDGEDTLVIYEGYRDQYTIALRSDGVSTLDGPGQNGETIQVDLYNMERIQFNDGILDLSSITTVVANPAAGNPSLVGTDASEWIGGTAADDTISAGGGDDEIYAPLGTNEIDGGDGEDTLLVYQGNQADYVLSNIGDGRIYIEGPGIEWRNSAKPSKQR